MKKSVMLPNGVRLALVSESNSLNAGIAVVVAAGGWYERSEKQQGLTHLNEHLMLHQTQRHETYRDLAMMLDWTTSDDLVETGPTSLTIAFEAPRSRVRSAIDLIADIVLRPDINREAIDRELSRIRDEHDLGLDEIEQWVDDCAEDLVFDGSPMANPLLGASDALRQLIVRDVEEWHRTIVRGRRIAVALVGNFNAVDAEKQIRRKFGRIPPGPGFTPARFSVTQGRSRLRIFEKPFTMLHLRIAVPTVGFIHPDRLPLTVLNNHLGKRKRNSSRLALRLLATGLAYTAETDLWYYGDVGTLTIRAAIRRENLRPTLVVLRDELDRLRNDRLRSDELGLALYWVKRDGREHKSMPLSQARFLAMQLLSTGEMLSIDQFIQAVNRTVRARDIRRVAQTTLLPERMNVVLAGPCIPSDADLIIETLGLTNVDMGGDGIAETTAQEV